MISIAMVTVDRAPRQNYLAETLQNLGRAGVLSSPVLHSFSIFDSGPGPMWTRSVLSDMRLLGSMGPLVNYINIVYPEKKICANSNVSIALNSGGRSDAPWILFLEDDIDVCANFLESVASWLEKYAQNRYHIYAFGAAYETVVDRAQRGIELWPYPIDSFFGTQAIAIRSSDALSLSIYIGTNALKPIRQILPDGTPHMAVGSGYDLLMVEWAKALGQTHFLASCPSFVQHIGMESMLLSRAGVHTFDSWLGREWSYAV